MIMPSQKTPEPLNKNLALICATIIAICLIVGGVVLFGGKVAAPVVSVQPQPAKTAVDISKVKIAGEAFVGQANAPVVIAIWSDYQCPFCEKYYTQTYGQIIKDYVETGKIKYVMRDLPLSFHPFAHVAAEAARCAGEQEKYIKFHDELFKNQAAWVAAKDPTDLFAGYAVKVGLRRADFVSCFKNGKTKEAVDADLALAGKVGAGGTPTFFINGKILVGAQPYSAFQAAIDAALGQ